MGVVWVGVRRNTPGGAPAHGFPQCDGFSRASASLSGQICWEELRLAEIFGEVTGASPVMWGLTMADIGCRTIVRRF